MANNEMLSEDSGEYQIKSENNDKRFKVKAGVFLTSVAGISALVGFGSTLALVKRKDPEFFNKGVMGSRELAETGASLAMRALGWGTLYAVTGCSVLCFAIWKLVGAQDLTEFRMKVGSALPRIPRNDPPQGRTEFEGLTDLLNYVIAEGSKKPKN